MDVNLLNDIIGQFNIGTTNIAYKQISQGYINDTYLVSQSSEPKYILQRINRNVFKNVIGLHNNIHFALKRLKADDYSAIQLYKTKQGQSYFNEKENCWRLLNNIPNSKAYDITSNSKVAFEAGSIIARFHQLLKDEILEDYVDTVSNLNYFPFRIKEFNDALIKTSNSLKEVASKQIEFAISHLDLFNDFYNAKLPKRICHNDTKLNNILFDSNNQGLCLIDLDTIMGGYFHYDFGDAVRTIVSEANEDEKELTKIGFNTSLFEHFVKGINNNGPFLSQKEIDYLPICCVLMPILHGLRALTDYLNGNIHYKVAYPDQNLDRCKSLFQFASLARIKQSEIKVIIDNIIKKAT